MVLRGHTYIVGVSLKVDAQSKTLLTKDGLTMSTSTVGLLLWLGDSVLVDLDFIAHLSINIVATFAHHLGLGQLPHGL